MSDPVAYRFRPPERTSGRPREWHYDTPEGLPEVDRETLREKGWEIEPLTVLEEEDE